MVQWPGLLPGNRVNLSHQCRFRAPRARSGSAPLGRRGGLLSTACQAAAGVAAPPATRARAASTSARTPRLASCMRPPPSGEESYPLAARSQGGQRPLGHGEIFIIRAGKLSRFHTRTWPPPDVGDGLRRACRGAWICHFPMGRRTQCRRPGGRAAPRRIRRWAAQPRPARRYARQWCRRRNMKLMPLFSLPVFYLTGLVVKVMVGYRRFVHPVIAKPGNPCL
jgi:hypothetical protein